MNDQQIMMQMEINVGHRCSFVGDHGVMHGVITGVSNAEHYVVTVDHPCIWEWYVRAESIRLE